MLRACAWRELLELLSNELAGIEFVDHVEETHELRLVPWQDLQMIDQLVPLMVV